jgi:hypothetical protein
MKAKHVFVAAIVVVVLFMLKNTEGYADWPTQVLASEQANDTYLEALLKRMGYAGKRVDGPDVNRMESTRLAQTLDRNGYRSQAATPLIQLGSEQSGAPSFAARSTTRPLISYEVIVAGLVGLALLLAVARG